VASRVGKQANALREELIKALPDNPVLATTPPFAVGDGAFIGALKAADVAAVLHAMAAQIPNQVSFA
jgi:hypothetical protein